MSHESCHTYEWVMSHIWMSRAHEWVMSHVTHTNDISQGHCAVDLQDLFFLQKQIKSYDGGKKIMIYCFTRYMNASHHTYEWVVSQRYASWGVMSHIEMSHVSHVHMIHVTICVTETHEACLLPQDIRMFDMTHSRVRHESFTCATWRIHMHDMTHSHVYMTHQAQPPSKSYSHVWHDAFTCATWIIHMCDKTNKAYLLGQVGQQREIEFAHTAILLRRACPVYIYS